MRGKHREKKAIVLVTLLFLVGAAAGCSPAREEPAGIRPEDIGAEYSPAQLREDVEALVKTIEQVHPDPYAHTPADAARAEFAQIADEFNAPPTRLDLYRAAAPAVTALGDGHTGLIVPEEEWDHHLSGGGTLFPLEVEIHDGRIFVAAPLSRAVDLAPGSEILSIEGTDAGDICRTLLQYVSGERQSFRERVLQRRFARLLWLIYGWEDEFVLQISDGGSGAAKTVTVPGAAAEDLELDARPGGDEPPYAFRVLPQLDAGLMDIRSFTDADRFDAFLRDAFARLREDDIAHLIIDIRQNGGGSSRLGDALLEYLTDRPFTQFKAIEIKVSEQIREHYRGWSQLRRMEIGSIHTMEVQMQEPGENPLRFAGEVYLLTGPFTFSSAASFAAACKHYGVATLVGEETGGLRETFGDVYRTRLPHTRLQLGVSHKHFISPGDDERGITPHHHVPVTPEDVRAGVDPVMQFVRDLIRNPPR